MRGQAILFATLAVCFHVALAAGCREQSTNEKSGAGSSSSSHQAPSGNRPDEVAVLIRSGATPGEVREQIEKNRSPRSYPANEVRPGKTGTPPTPTAGKLTPDEQAFVGWWKGLSQRSDNVWDDGKKTWVERQRDVLDGSVSLEFKLDRTWTQSGIGSAGPYERAGTWSHVDGVFLFEVTQTDGGPRKEEEWFLGTIVNGTSATMTTKQRERKYTRNPVPSETTFRVLVMKHPGSSAVSRFVHIQDRPLEK